MVLCYTALAYEHKENVFGCKRYTIKFSKVKGHHDNLLSNDSDKFCTVLTTFL